MFGLNSVWCMCSRSLWIAPPALFVREISVHMTALIFLQIASIFQGWVSCSVSKHCSGSKCWRRPGRAVTTCHSVPATSLSPGVQDTLCLRVVSVVAQSEGIKRQQINGHPIDCPLSSPLAAGRYCLFIAVSLLLPLCGFAWRMYSHPLKHRFEDREVAVKAVKRNTPLQGFVCFLVYWPGCLICWVPLTICGNLYVLVGLKMGTTWIIMVGLDRCRGTGCSGWQMWQQDEERLWAVVSIGLPSAPYKSKHYQRRKDCQKSHMITSVLCQTPFFPPFIVQRLLSGFSPLSCKAGGAFPLLSIALLESPKLGWEICVAA